MEYSPGSEPSPDSGDGDHGLEQDGPADAVESLEEYETRDAQLAAEDQLVRLLRSQGFEGEEYEAFEARLMRYALKVLDVWLQYGQVFSECASVGRPVSPTDRERTCLRRSREDREDIATMVVGLAIVRFRADALLGGGWQSSKGASITTYFMNGVKLEFANEFRKWQGEGRRWAPPSSMMVPLEICQMDPADLLAQRETVVASLRDLSESDRTIIALHYDGWSNAEIAEVVGRTVKAVAGVVRRWREQQRLRMKGA